MPLDPASHLSCHLEVSDHYGYCDKQSRPSEVMMDIRVLGRTSVIPKLGDLKLEETYCR